MSVSYYIVTVSDKVPMQQCLTKFQCISKVPDLIILNKITLVYNNYETQEHEHVLAPQM